MLLWGIGTAFKVIQTFFLAIPNTIAALVPNDINPFPPDPITGVYPTNPIAVAVAVIVGYAAFWFLFSLVIQREV
jgi:hypothetical protein